MFHRSTTDQSFTPLDLRDFYAAPEGAACWLMGGGPSLTRLPLAEIRASHIPIMAVNLAGQGHLIPDFWTAYDPTARFLPSIYRSPRTLKFLHRRRSMDLLPGGTHKLCECPGLVFFENEKRDFTHAFSPQANKILDWNDSLIQAIDILFHLGFRTLYLAGCELSIAPAKVWNTTPANPSAISLNSASRGRSPPSSPRTKSPAPNTTSMKPSPSPPPSAPTSTTSGPSNC
jgi:hypothetical protein